MSNNPVHLVTRSGLKLLVRPAGAEDGPILQELFHHVSQDDLRFRFLSGLNEIGPEQLRALIPLNDGNMASFFIAFAENGTPVASGLLAWDVAVDRGEVAISVHAEYRNHGIGWTLLSFIADEAESRGLKSIESIESRANVAAIELERDMGFSVAEYPGDPTLTLVGKPLSNRARSDTLPPRVDRLAHVPVQRLVADIGNSPQGLSRQSGRDGAKQIETAVEWPTWIVALNLGQELQSPSTVKMGYSVSGTEIDSTCAVRTAPTPATQ
ncbi:GNAT family N-acetyltransferase [Rhizorhapis sp. SPR117]|uniref:GNAT family N-acetyltransferase n=1 Tax=Rhizorhapis sp. SPR117 TaxID=2912611 RepID=UPI001F26BD3E|nr:GNAT family N-acetyltransferase [Rhizorhapis sp. SPR117]